MIKRAFSLLFLTFLIFGVAVAVRAQSDSETTSPERLILKTEYFTGKVMEITGEEPQQGPSGDGVNQSAKVLLTSGSQKGQIIEVPSYFSSSPIRKLKKGEAVVINKTHGLTADTYYVADKYRIWPAVIATLIFIGAVVLLTRRQNP